MSSNAKRPAASWFRRTVLSAVTLILATYAWNPRTAGAATITSINAAWPAAPAVQSVDALSVTHANRAINTTRINRQSITVANSVTVGSIYLSASNYGNLPFIIQFFETTNVLGNPLVEGAQVGSDIVVDAFGSTDTGDRNIAISLSGAEQITLPGVAGPNGYVVTIKLADSSATGSAFNWVHANTGANIYVEGRYRRDDGNQDGARDYGVALVAVPEASSFVLLLAGAATGLVHRRARGDH
jgi:hypothetical protein